MAWPNPEAAKDVRVVSVVTGEDFLSPSFPAVTLTAGRTWHQAARLAVYGWHACALGCRGFTGPIPPPLWMSVIQLWAKRDKSTAVLPGATIRQNPASRGDPAPRDPWH